jgi:hypothetical protein
MMPTIAPVALNPFASLAIVLGIANLAYPTLFVPLRYIVGGDLRLGLKRRSSPRLAACWSLLGFEDTAG